MILQMALGSMWCSQASSQTEAKAAAAQTDTARAAAAEAKRLASSLDIATAPLRREPPPSGLLAPGASVGLAAGGLGASGLVSSQQPSLLSSTSAKGSLLLPDSPEEASGLPPNQSVVDSESSQPVADSLAGQPVADSLAGQPVAAESEHSQPAAASSEMPSGKGLSRRGSVAAEAGGMGGLPSPRAHTGRKLGLQLHVSSNAEEAIRRRLSPRSPQNHGPGVDSAPVAVPAWESNSAAAWVKQKSLDRFPSTAKQVSDEAQEEATEALQEHVLPDQVASNSPAGSHSPSSRQGRSVLHSPASGIDRTLANSPSSGQGRALGALHIEVQPNSPQDALQEWTESGLDDIAAAVAEYTGSSPAELMTNATDDQQDQPNDPQRTAGSPFAAPQASAMSPGRAYLAQQQQMDADFDAAMAAEVGASAKPQYATAQEQMEAELEAAMAAELAGGAEQGDADGQLSNQNWHQLQQEAEKAADDVFSSKLRLSTMSQSTPLAGKSHHGL